ncbi:hypothetical protein AB1N83_009197, partial [Pleurotus pulmonarius]
MILCSATRHHGSPRDDAPALCGQYRESTDLPGLLTQLLVVKLCDIVKPFHASDSRKRPYAHPVPLAPCITSSTPPVCSITSEQEQMWLPKLSRYYVPDHVSPFTHTRRGVFQGVLEFNMWHLARLSWSMNRCSVGKGKTGISWDIHSSSQRLPVARP